MAQPQDWLAYNQAYPESSADIDFLEVTDYLGAVDPVKLDTDVPWWSGWTLAARLGGQHYQGDYRWINSGIRDLRNQDSDNDGVADRYDAFPDDSSRYSDSDRDGIDNNVDDDDDNDGVVDDEDAFPLDVKETVDSDGDGVGDNGDVFPNDDSESIDSDGDGVGDNSDVDADGNGYADCPVGMPEVDPGLCLLPDRIEDSSHVVLHARSKADDYGAPEYLLDHRLEIGDNWFIDDRTRLDDTIRRSSSLTLEPGAHVRSTERGMIVVHRGSKLFSEGTADRPITFSSIDDDNEGVGEWGGIAILGFAPIYEGRPENDGEERHCVDRSENRDHDYTGSFNWCNQGSNFGEAGGDHFADSSGVLKYVRITEAGYREEGQGAMPAITFVGVGNGTEVSHIQVSHALSHAIELEGGTLDFSHLVFNSVYQSDLLTHRGYQGNIQFLVSQKPDELVSAHQVQGHDAYSVNSSERDWGARYTHVKVANATVSGGQWVNRSFDQDDHRSAGFLLANATSTSIHNSAILGFDAGCIEINDRQVYQDGADKLYATQVTVGNTHGYCAEGFYRPWSPRGGQITTATQDYGIRKDQFDLSATMAAEVGYLVEPLVVEPVNFPFSSFAFEMTDYVGAVDPNAASSWFSEWVLTDVEGDNCPLISNLDQTDSDSDGRGDACDRDDDNDGVEDAFDLFPFDDTESRDTDSDLIGNNADTDDDNDGISDIQDVRPLVAACPLGTTEVPLDEVLQSRFGNNWEDRGVDAKAVALTAPALCQLPTQISEDLTLDARSSYLISGPVVVGNGHNELGSDSNLADGTPIQSVTLTIPKGTRIEVERHNDLDGPRVSFLQVTRGSRIMAQGTADEPIVFHDEGLSYYQTGQWGGIVIQGLAGHSDCAADSSICNAMNVHGAGLDQPVRVSTLGYAGGNNEDDSSGVLSYVVISGAGRNGESRFDSAEETLFETPLAGLSLQSVGKGTIIENIQINHHGNGSDAALDVSGGSVGIKQLAISHHKRDSILLRSGYQGNLQDIFVHENHHSDHRRVAIRAVSEAATQRITKPTIANALIVAGKSEPCLDCGGDSESFDFEPYAMSIEGGAGGFFHNMVVTVDPESQTEIMGCFRIDSSSQSLIGTGLIVNNLIQDCAKGGGSGYLAIDGEGNVLGGLEPMTNGSVLSFEPTFRTTLAVNEIEAMLSQPIDWNGFNSAYPASTADADFLKATDYIGAVDPVLDDDTVPWWSQWTVDCTLANRRFRDQPNGWNDRWACTDSGISDPRSHDNDGDGIGDLYDAFPDDRSQWLDTDLDGIGNNRDTDDDNDGVIDDEDAFPLDANETLDSDGDGVGDNGDVFPDDDSESIDSDGDGVGDNSDVDADGNGYADCPVGTTEVEDGVCQLPESIQASSHLILHHKSKADDYGASSYLLVGETNVGGEYGHIHDEQQLVTLLSQGSTLTIEPGAHIRAAKRGQIIVHRGSKIIAEGTAEQPITFSSDDEGYDGYGEWGGIALVGFAPRYSSTDDGDKACFDKQENTDNRSLDSAPFNWCNEGNNWGTAGGNLNADSSGILRYVRIFEAGERETDHGDGTQDEPALALISVGYGTQLSHLQIGNVSREGIYFEGGTVNLDHLVFNEVYGRDLFQRFGYRGNIQYLLSKKPDTPEGEVSNLPYTHYSQAISFSEYEGGQFVDVAIANATLIGGDRGNNSDDPWGRSASGVLLAGGSSTRIFNTAISGFDAGCVEIYDRDGVPFSTYVKIKNTHGYCTEGFYHRGSDRDAATDTNGLVAGPFGLTPTMAADVSYLVDPLVESPVEFGSAFAFDPTDYVGAVNPNVLDNWFSQWLLMDTEDDNCPLVSNPDQDDYDSDGRGDACDRDDDNDGVEDAFDLFPFNTTESYDSDRDGVGNNADTDDDNDGISDIQDVRPLVAACPLGTTEVSMDRSFDAFYGHWSHGGIDKEAVAIIAPALCQLPAQISEDLTLDPRSAYYINGPVVVGNGHGEFTDNGDLIDGTSLQRVTLTIPAGTKLYAENDDWRFYESTVEPRVSRLQVTRGSRIVADGNRQNPIVMTDIGHGYGGSGRWGGLIIQGRAGNSSCDDAGPCNAYSTGLGFSGGGDEFDDSGVLKHVVITGAGQHRAYFDEALGQHIEIRSGGLTLQSVGQGTVIDTLQIDETGSGASVQFSGGSVNAKRLVLTRQGSTMLSMDSGYVGNLQHVFVNQRDWSYLGSAIRVSSDEMASRKTTPTLANFTVVGSRGEYHGGADELPEPDTHIIGITGGAGVFMHNTAITVDPIAKAPIEACIEADEMSELLVGTSLYYENIITDCSTNSVDTGHVIIRDNGLPISGLDYSKVFSIDRPTIGETLSIQESVSVLVEPTDWNTVVGNNNLSTAQPGFLDPTDYIGAVDPLAGYDSAPWWSEWSILNSLGGDWVADNSHRWITTGISDARKIDSDGDGIADLYDAFPENGSERYDTDLDGIGNSRDTDDDNDGVTDDDDEFPLDVNETVDSDGDGVGDNR
jgi:hypothetical protein